MNLQASEFFLQHLSRFFGKPFDIESYRSEDGESRLRLATFDRRFKQFRIYASLGLSDLKVNDERLGEIVLLSDDFRLDVKQLFVHFLLFILDKDIPLESKFSIGGIERINPDFADHYNKVGLYVGQADGFGPGFGDLECQNEPGRVYQGMFVSFAEMDLIQRQGGALFEEKLKAQGASGEVCSLQRPSCV